MAQIGTIKVETQNNGTVDVPVFETGDSSSEIYEFVRVETASGTGFIPVTDTGNAAYPYLRVQSQNNGIVAITDTPGSKIPDSGDLHARYDATALSLSDGGSVTTWPDETGNGYDLTEGAAPQYVADGINGNPVVYFDGVDDYLDVVFSNLSQPNHVFVVGRYVGGSNERIFQSPDGSARNHIDSTINGNFGIYAGNTLDNGVSADTAPHVLTARFDGSNSLHRVDASDQVTGDAGSEGMGGIGLGGNQNASDFGEVEVGEVLVYPMDKSGIRGNVEQYLADKWGITL